MELKRQLGLFTGILIIVADMIGTGVFMTTGNLLGMTGDALLVLMLWGIGGIVALTGSLCYAELSATWPDVGGEYVYLKRIFGLLPAFLTGWVSLVVGFSAPVAASSLLLVQYVNSFFHITAGGEGLLSALWVQKGAASALVLFFGLLHILGVRRGGYFQNFLTLLKILLVVSLIGFGLTMADWGHAGRLVQRYGGSVEAAPGLPVTGLALLIVMFAYSGWNGASYIAGEVKNPERNLPRILLYGTVLTTVFYLLLNMVFLMAAPGEAIAGKDEIGAIAAAALFGPRVSGFFTLGIAVVLLSAVSVQMMVGPRVYYAMARDGLIFRSLSKIHPRFETPALAICIQMAFAVLYIFTGSAMTLVIYMGFALNVFPVLTVVGLMILRRREPGLRRPYRVPLYPLVPLVYIGLSIAMMIAALLNWTSSSLFAIGVLALGVPVFYVWKKIAGVGRSAD
ncbi:MAG TPA: amino acid permease [Spirochaetota bacterium]|nr:MAG: Serine/threonine exchanger SteT [Spirochaetes bacterium ADurb.BinA120]HNU92430.1 amino acid permease [Spirochaetota bacterium]HPI15760.1 amino acid permease [Spirochaetota bacterium]HPV98785.1 amino acid permease [Spirochaetota bacterium]